MLIHIVMWKFKEFAEGATRVENAKIMKEKLESLVGIVPGLLYAEVGVDFKHSQMNYDAVLTCHFNSEEELEAYKVHPAHVEVSDFCEKIRESRVAVDYWR